MDLSRRKEQFSVAYARAVCAVAGFKIFTCDVDDETVDLTVGSTKAVGTVRKSPRLDIQLKCTETDDGVGELLSFAMHVRNYDDLRDDKVHVPQILVVLCVPRDPNEWLAHHEDHTILRRTAYWVSVRGQPSSTNTKSKTVHVPRTQRFDVTALTEMMMKIGEGVLP